MEKTETKNPQIYGLIGKAMGMIGAIGKDSAAVNYSGKKMYNFRGIDQVYNALNPVMSELGLFIIPEVLDQKREERESANKTTLIYSIVTVRFTMYAPDGSSVSGTVIGEGMDSGDKATNKAMSIAMKYFCFQVFCIPTEEMKDPDAEVHEVLPKKQETQKEPEFVRPVTTSAAAVETVKKVNPVFAFINNEKAFMAERFECSKEEMNLKFGAFRKSLIDGGVVEDIPAEKLTMEQARDLIDAIYKNFMTDQLKKVVK